MPDCPHEELARDLAETIRRSKREAAFAAVVLYLLLVLTLILLWELIP